MNLYRYEEYLCEQNHESITTDLWEKIWSESPAKTIEHIHPQTYTDYGIAGLVYGSVPGSGGCNENIEYQKLIVLCTDICERNGKNKLLWLEDKDRTLNYKPVADEMVLTVHRWFANKSCPGNWMYS